MKESNLPECCKKCIVRSCCKQNVDIDCESRAKYYIEEIKRIYSNENSKSIYNT